MELKYTHKVVMLSQDMNVTRCKLLCGHIETRSNSHYIIVGEYLHCEQCEKEAKNCAWVQIGKRG